MNISKNAVLRICIAGVWFLNGFYCKLLNLVPRHQMIVARILGNEHAFLFTRIIGILEIMMSFWVISRWKSRVCTGFQVILIATMNTIEFIKAPDLLLFGHGNAILAGLLIVAILFNEFAPGQKSLVTFKQGDV